MKVIAVLIVLVGVLISPIAVSPAQAASYTFTECSPAGFSGMQTCVVYTCNEQGQCIETDRYTWYAVIFT